MILVQGPMIFGAGTKGILHVVSSAMPGKLQRNTTSTPVSYILYIYIVPVPGYHTRHAGQSLVMRTLLSHDGHDVLL